MRIRHADRDGEERSHLQMSSMIDVVFLLLIFFVMTFQITAAEGDIEIDMARSPASGVPPEPPRKTVFHVHLVAGDRGSLSEIRFDAGILRSLAELEAVVRNLVAHAEGDQYAVQLHSDPTLHYQHVMDAITAIRGDDLEQPMIQEIQFLGGN